MQGPQGETVLFAEWHPLHNLYYVSRRGCLERGPYLGFLCCFFFIKTNLNWVLEAVLRWGMVVSERSWPSVGREMDTHKK